MRSVCQRGVSLLAGVFLFLALCAVAHAAALASGATQGPSGREDSVLRIHFFHATGCPHCVDAEAYLRRYAGDPRIEIRRYEVNYDPAGRAALERVVAATGLRDVSVPYLVIGGWSTIGYQGDEWTGALIDEQVQRCLRTGCPDPVSAILAGEWPIAATGPASVELPASLRLPFWGPVSTANLSLPMLTVVLGAVDGFNPCAMWALVFLLGLLMGVNDRRRMWILGITFLAGSAIVYFLIMAAWLKVLLTLGFLVWMRVIVAIVALAAAGFYFHDFFVNPEAACEVSHTPARQSLLARLRRFALDGGLWPAMLGVLALAIVVNLIELVCSAGIPAVYTQVLAMTPMPLWQYYAYLLLYIVVFMADDILIFALAATTLHFATIGTGYARASRLVGGIILGAIGFILLLRPEWLSF